MQTIQDINAAHPEYSVTQIVDAYNAQFPLYRRVPTQEIKQFLTDNRLNGPLRLAKENTQLPVELRAGIIEFLATLDNFDYLDATNSENRTDVENVTSGLVSVGVISQTNKDTFGDLLLDPNFSETTEEIVESFLTTQTREKLRLKTQLALNAAAVAFDNVPTTDPTKIIKEIHEAIDAAWSEAV